MDSQKRKLGIHLNENAFNEVNKHKNKNGFINKCITLKSDLVLFLKANPKISLKAIIEHLEGL